MVENGSVYRVQWTSQYKKDVKLAKKRNYNMEELYAVVKMLADDVPLDVRYHDHALEGDWAGHRELHIRPDWLLVYQKIDGLLLLELSRTGTHSDLFGK